MRIARLLSVLVLLAVLSMERTTAQAVVSMSDYTAYPAFVSKTVPPNILFLVDFSEAMLPAAYGMYPISYLSTATYSSNYKGAGLTVTTTPLNATTPAALADAFDPTATYFGFFDPMSCYAFSSHTFTGRVTKPLAVTDACAGSQPWDGNFLNWLGMRKIDQAKQVLIGGRTLSASSNTDGTANSIAGEPKTGQGGSANTCNGTTKPCYRYVKFVPSKLLAGRMDPSLAADMAWSAGGSEAPGTISSSGTTITGTGTQFLTQFQAGDSIIAGGQTRVVSAVASQTTLTTTSAFSSTLSNASYYAPGRYFGAGEAFVYINTGASVNPFGNANPTYNLAVDLTGETPAYQQQYSLGLLQTMRTDNMRVAVMFTNSGSGVAATVFRAFDGIFNASAITGIRNQSIAPYAGLAEATYEALCYYRNGQGPCFSNSPADFAASLNSQGDPYFSVALNQTVRCCKSYILMISSGVPTNDQNNAPSPSPFGNLLTAGSDLYGLPTTRLDDVAYYGHIHDLRTDLTGTQSVAFYAVNAMGDASGATILSSAAKFGGFEDSNGNNLVESGTTTCTYPANSLLSTGTTTTVSSLEWDVNHDCVPDTYFEASGGGALRSQVNAAIQDILKKSASGSSVSVLATSGTGEGSLYQAYFFPEQTDASNNTVAWLGYTQGLFLDAFGNLREDTNGDGRLVYQTDLIIKTAYNTSTQDVDVLYYHDTDGNGVADTTSPFQTLKLKDVNTIWEAGRQLAFMDPNARTLLTWVDSNNDGGVGSGEVIPFTTANATTLSPYLALSLSGGATPFTATNIINYVRGNQVSGLRNRQLYVNDSTGTPTLVTWKYGDPVDSTPTVVGAPVERYDVLYGDATYQAFYQQYRSRRQVVYVGANDGMLHAFNAGFYHRGDDPTTASVTEHGWFTRTPADNSGGPVLGQELWGFIPYQLLPHLQWLANASYTHVYYVDLKPKITDARIFTPDADHPGGWGTILIGGFRLGGSCGECTSTTGGTPMTVTADFGSGIQTRTFYSAYFILDITNPERPPVLLWSYSAPDQGFTTSYPTVVRTNPSTSPKTDGTNEKWFVLLGTGVSGYDGSVMGPHGSDPGQVGKLVALEMPKPYAAGSALVVSKFSTSDLSAFGPIISVDTNLDFRTDVTYQGTLMSNPNAPPPTWIGKFSRLLLNGGNTGPTTWGVTSSSGRSPTLLLTTFPASGPTQFLGPITSGATASIDDSNHLWVFFGTGRFYNQADKANTDTQYFLGVKDPVVTGGCADSLTGCQRPNLLNVSSAQICTVCTGGLTQVSGLSGITTFDTGSTSLVGTVQSMDGWFTRLPAAGERVLSDPRLLGGTAFFTTFIPDNDICDAAGTGNVYALFYLTGTAYKNPIIGQTTTGSNTFSSTSVSLGTGLPSQMAVQIGQQGSGLSGTASGSGCQGSVTGFIQGSTGAINQLCAKPALPLWSRYISWNNQRL